MKSYYQPSVGGVMHERHEQHAACGYHLPCVGHTIWHIVNKIRQWSLLARCCSSSDVMYEEQMYLESQSGTARLDKFTHSLLVKSNVEVSPFLLKAEEPPMCIRCDELLTVEHILLTCSDLIEIRESHFTDADH